MKRFSVYLALVLLVSLPLKASYFTDVISQESEVAGRQLIGQGIVELLQADGFTPTLAPTDGFLPSVAATKGNCRLYITPIPAQNDLDAAFLFASQGVGGDYAYYYDGEVYTDPRPLARNSGNTPPAICPKSACQSPAACVSASPIQTPARLAATT